MRSRRVHEPPQCCQQLAWLLEPDTKGLLEPALYSWLREPVVHHRSGHRVLLVLGVNDPLSDMTREGPRHMTVLTQREREQHTTRLEGARAIVLSQQETEQQFSQMSPLCQIPAYSLCLFPGATQVSP